MTTVLTTILIVLSIYYLIGICLAFGWSGSWPRMRNVWVAIAIIAWFWPFLLYIDEFDD